MLGERSGMSFKCQRLISAKTKQGERSPGRPYLQFMYPLGLGGRPWLSQTLIAMVERGSSGSPDVNECSSLFHFTLSDRTQTPQPQLCWGYLYHKKQPSLRIREQAVSLGGTLLILSLDKVCMESFNLQTTSHRCMDP